MRRRASIVALLALLAMLASFVFPVGRAGDDAVSWWAVPSAMAAALAGLLTAAAAVSRRAGPAAGAAFAAGALAAAMVAPVLIARGLVLGGEAPGLWLFLLGLAFLVWRALELLSGTGERSLVGSLLVPGLFGLWLLYLWQVLVVGFSVPSVLLPAPSQIAGVIGASLDVLWQDFRQTFLKAVMAGFVLGSAAGFATALLIDRSPFLQRGLLPLGSLVSAIPIVGIAPIMVMWFGFDWQSKAAVIVVMTFFPMLINTLAGLHATDEIDRDLMRSYAAGYLQSLIKLRLPNALPFIFNALKINSTLALIGGIVAEFFGTPIVGMGFRISVEIGRMNVEMVWATIAVAALAGSMFYGVLALVERGLTFWHPSYRQSAR